jgi:MinD superfamily P-loop ATPase|tara:strand:+ start:223 stop:411 length:189 start_codon:yes stop_codon:yes gene_type:complete
MTNDDKVSIDYNACMSCGGCVGVCPFRALDLDNGTKINPILEVCNGCGICIKFCPVGAINLG